MLDHILRLIRLSDRFPLRIFDENKEKFENVLRILEQGHLQHLDMEDIYGKDT